jgi:hypothetical protein
MERAMTSALPPPWHSVRVAAARLRQRLGIPGLLGVALFVGAAGLALHQWRLHGAARASLVAEPPAAAIAGGGEAGGVRPLPRVLPSASDVPQQLTRIERAATGAGLGWPRAEYRVVAATQDTPAMLEVRCTLKGPYPALRRFVTALLQDQPALTLKEFSLARPAADVVDVEARLAVVVYLAEGRQP